MIIAQISDIHAAADNDNLQRLERALAWLATLAPDALVLTGDLADNRHCGHDLLAACLNAVPCRCLSCPAMPITAIGCAPRGPSDSLTSGLRCTSPRTSAASV